MASELVIIETGVANTASVSAAARRIGLEPVLTIDADRVAGAGLVMLPGVGSFGAGMARLRETGLDTVLLERLSADRPLVAVCLGMQLLSVASEESAGVAGLGVVDVPVTAFGMGVRTPQFGWNLVQGKSGLVEPGHAYFANSFRYAACPEGWSAAWAEHGGPFVAAMQRGRTLACQFHPELSGAWGVSLLRRWAESCGAELSAEEASRC